ncbi:unnamed protein product [Symbiodinium sp. CCMP2592]|nr:unnamed protein product [Symbiodinium sp. CCMP2592]
MDLDWPPLQGELMTKLKSCFTSPRQLHYDFDDDRGARRLVEILLPGMGASNLQLAVDQLVKWHKEGAGVVAHAKRVARAGLMESLVGQHTVSASATSEAFDRLAHSNPLSLLPAIERARKARENSVDPSKRAAEEKAAKAKYAMLLYNILVEAKTPIVEILKEVADPEEACVRIFGTRRSKTLRNRYHSWNKFGRWLEVSKGRVWPAGLQDLLDYATEAVKEGAGKTTIDAFAAALSVLEQVGRVGEGDMLSRDPTWVSYSKNVTAELVEKGPVLHQAAQPTVAMALSLELYVFDEDRVRYARAMAFVALLMLWGSMRSDDVQCMRPESMRLTIEGLSCKLWKTKTTGPDRRINMVPLFISRKASFSGLDWLKKGHQIWSEIEYKRDFLVLQASDDWETCGNKGVDASAVSLYVRKIYKELCVPRWAEGRWIQNKERLLLPGDCALHFSGHSARNFLTSIAAAIRVPKDDRDFLGRWKVGGGGSADYTRTARQIVHRIQEQVTEVVLLGRERGYVEADALDALQSFAEERGEIGAVIRARHERATKVGGNPRLGGRYPPLYMQSIPGPHVIAEEADEDQRESAAAPKEEAKYFISVSKKTGRRLPRPGMAVTEAEMRERVSGVDADLQYVLQEAGASLATQYAVCNVHTTLRRFQAIADDRAGSRTAANTDFGVPADTPAGRQQTAAIVAAWELAKEISSKEIELRAEARALNQPRILQTQERQAMMRAVSAAYGKLNEAETPSAEYLALKAEETEQNEPTAAQLDTITSKRGCFVLESPEDLGATKDGERLQLPPYSLWPTFDAQGLTGLRKACHDFPLATKCLVRFVRSVRPFHPFSTISIYDNVCTALHKDSRNACCENLIIPLTQFSGGELWLQQDNGAIPQTFGGSEVFGTAMPIPHEGLCFDARGILHCTMPWKGRRLIVVAFTVSKTEELKQPDLGCRGTVMSSTESLESDPPAGGVDQQADDVFRPELCGNFGNPLMLEWDGRESPITHGYGLCSPTRWHPASRGASLPKQSKDLSRRLNGLVQQFVAEQVPDCQLLALKLATGQILESPFDEGAMRRLREDWAALVCETDGAKHEGLLEAAFGISADVSEWFYQLCFVDDIHGVFTGAQKFRNLVMTDAKCADGFVVLADWELSDDTKTSKWFSLRLTPGDAPYLFDQEGKSQWASGSAELLATLAALHIFGYLTASVDRKELDIECAADTDNQGNSRLLKKGSSTKWPLMLINMQLSDLLLRSSVKLLLRWRPRDENQYADQLTNEIFTNFSDEHRIACTYSDLPLSLLQQFWETKESFDSARRAPAVLQQDASGHRQTRAPALAVGAQSAPGPAPSSLAAGSTPGPAFLSPQPYQSPVLASAASFDSAQARGFRLPSAKVASTNRRGLDPAGVPAFWDSATQSVSLSHGHRQEAFATSPCRKGQQASRKAKALEQWKELLWLLGDSADLYRSLQEAKYSQQLLTQSKLPFTAGTLETYLSACRQFVEYLILNSLDISSISVASLGDLLWACHCSLEAPALSL